MGSLKKLFPSKKTQSGSEFEGNVALSLVERETGVVVGSLSPWGRQEWGVLVWSQRVAI